MGYTIGQDMIFVILALISALAMLSEQAVISFIFFLLAILFVSFEKHIFEYVRNA